MSGSASEGQESASERIFREAPLSFVLLEGLLEVGRRGLEASGLGPVGEQGEQVAEVPSSPAASSTVSVAMAMGESSSTR
jgi:hypothetical protein